MASIKYVLFFGCLEPTQLPLRYILEHPVTFLSESYPRHEEGEHLVEGGVQYCPCCECVPAVTGMSSWRRH